MSIYDYDPGCLDALSFGGFDRGKLLAIYVSAEKTAGLNLGRIPEQGMYTRRFT